MRPFDWLSKSSLPAFRRALLRWYRANGRDLPWRRQPDSYRVWISEIMLQQTQVATVLGYFDRFCSRFPTVQSLAAAELADVLHQWQGLGYYGRARNLHACAKEVVARFSGVLPRDVADLQSLPGLGRYTARAIACFALGVRTGILEANTIRLWSRLCAAVGDPKQAPLVNELWELADRVVPPRGAADFNAALMDLGATVCTARAPACTRCPVRQWCHAFVSGRPETFPQLAARRATVAVDHVSVVIRRGGRVLVVRRPPTGQWAGLWEFPRVERHGDETAEAAALRAAATVANRAVCLTGHRLTLSHGIMHYKVRLLCFDAVASVRRVSSAKARAKAPPRQGDDGPCWVSIECLPKLPFSSPQRKIVASLMAQLPK